MTAPCCSRCGLLVRWMPGYPQPEDGMPEGWTREGRSGSLRCLRCRREVAAQEAEAAAREAGLTGWRAKHEGQRALVRLELARDPDASNALIARRLGLASSQIVKKLRARLDAETAADGSPGVPAGGRCSRRLRRSHRSPISRSGAGLMPLSKRPGARARQLANLRGRTSRELVGNTNSLRHGGYGAISRERLEAEERRVLDAVSADLPLREGDGSVPAADGVMVTLLARR